MRYIAKILTIFLFPLLLFSCGKTPQETPAESFNVSGIVLPSSLESRPGAALTFQVMGGHGPATGDRVLLAGAKIWEMGILQADASSFSIQLPADIVSGEYVLSVKRGDQTKRVGSFRLEVQSDSEVEAEGSTVYGVVSSEGKGLAGVAVSDGVEICVTDKDGVYRLSSAKPHGYVFVSVPSGYEPLVDGILPRFHKALTAAADVPERVDFSLMKVSGQDRYTVLMLGDMHLANRTGDRSQFSAFVQDVNEFVASAGQKVYALTLGDMTWDLYWIVNAYGYQEYLRDASAIRQLPIYHTIGNHDHSMYFAGDVNTVKEYKEVIGPTYYSFNIGKVHYVVLDDVECTNSKPATDDKGNACYERDYKGNLVSQQMEWLKKDLALVGKDTPLVITMHIPLYQANGSWRMLASSGQPFEALLKPFREVHIFTAHTHKTYNVDHLATDHIYEHNAGAICATWWWSAYETPGVHIGQDGSPGGYTVVKVDGTSLQWQYKATGSGADYQFRSYDRNEIQLTPSKYVPQGGASYQAQFEPGIWASSSTANEVYLNVWNYDPSWKVEVSEGGKSLPVTAVSAKDPLHLVAYTAKRLNKGKTASFATDNNGHMFKVTASRPDSPLEIKVTDRFGQVYQETMARPKAFSTDAYKR